MKFKNYFLCSALLPVLAFVISGCKKDDDEEATTFPTPVITALVDSVEWSAASDAISGSIIASNSNVTGMSADSSTITFSIQEDFEVGETYDVGPQSGNAAIYVTKTGASWTSYLNPACSGSVTITAIDENHKRMSGTFSFTGYGNNSYKEITQGVFTDVTYKTALPGDGNTFSIDINGTPFNSSSVTGYVKGTKMILTTNNGQGATVNIELPFSTAGGIYNLTSFSAYKASYDPLSADYSISISGGLNILSHNYGLKKITGSCSFIAEPFAGSPPSYNLTNGTFSIRYY